MIGNLRKRGRGGRDAVDDRVGAFADIFDLLGSGFGPLAGLSFAAKDLFDVAGRPTGCGNPTWAATHDAAEADAAAVAACLGAGATLRGKTHTDELAYSLMGVNAHYGTPVNAAAPERLPGGSSSGSAAAVAAGLVDFALGSDTGGSVRLPASFCGLYGLRPTHGRVDVAGMAALAPSFDVVGWFAPDIWRLSAVAEVLDSAAPPPVARPRLLFAEDAWGLVGADVRAALRPSRDCLTGILGPAERVRFCDGPLSDWREVFRICQGAEAWAVHGAWISANTPVFGPGVAERFAAASRITLDEATAAKARRDALSRRLVDLLGDDGIVVLPTAPGPAPRRDAAAAELDSYRASALTLLCPAGLAGLPQLNIPAARLQGAPLGLSLLGPAGAERTLLQIAAQLEVCRTLPYTGV